MGTILGYTTHSRRELVRSSSRPRKKSGGEYLRFQCSTLELIWTAFLPYSEAGEKRRKRDPGARGARAEHEACEASRTVSTANRVPVRAKKIRRANPAAKREWESAREPAREANGTVHSLITRPLSARPARPRLHSYTYSASSP